MAKAQGRASSTADGVISEETTPSRRFLVVSVHDLSPVTWRRVQDILVALDRVGIAKRSLLLIPNLRGKAPLDGAPVEFLQWVRHLPPDNEICMHGYEHQAPFVQGGFISRLVARVYTAQEGEFYQLNGSQAAERLQKGLALLEKVGLRPSGFVAPAWLLSPETQEQLTRWGFAYTVRLRCIEILTPARLRLAAPTLCYSVRSLWRRSLSLLWNPTLAIWANKHPILRAAIHPVDLDHPAVFRQLIGLLERMARQRTVTTYGEVVNEMIRQGRLPAEGAR